MARRTGKGIGPGLILMSVFDLHSLGRVSGRLVLRVEKHLETLGGCPSITNRLSGIAKALPKGLNRSGMSTVSEQLRQARQAQNLTVEQVAEITKIRSDHLRALEAGNFEVFSAPVYIRGFTRSYSTLLKLDVPKIMATLDGELSQSKKFSEPPALSNRRRGLLDFFMLQLSKIDWRKGIIALGILAAGTAVLLGWLGWRHYRAKDPLKDLKPGLYHSTQHLSGQTLPLPSPSPRK